MKKLIPLLFITLMGCDSGTREVPPVYDEPSQVEDSSGIGMTYGGKLGVEIAPGLVMGFDGSIRLGFGF